MSRITILLVLTVSVLVCDAWADPTVLFSGQKFVRKQQDAAMTLSASSYRTLTSNFLGIKTTDVVDLATSQEVWLSAPSTFATLTAWLYKVGIQDIPSAYTGRQHCAS